MLALNHDGAGFVPLYICVRHGEEGNWKEGMSS